jgi:hypothetical protein
MAWFRQVPAKKGGLPLALGWVNSQLTGVTRVQGCCVLRVLVAIDRGLFIRSVSAGKSSSLSFEGSH